MRLVINILCFTFPASLLRWSLHWFPFHKFTSFMRMMHVLSSEIFVWVRTMLQRPSQARLRFSNEGKASYSPPPMFHTLARTSRCFWSSFSPCWVSVQSVQTMSVLENILDHCLDTCTVHNVHCTSKLERSIVVLLKPLLVQSSAN